MHFEPHMLPAGHTLYEYRIEGVLGAGGFGITYLGRDTHLGRWYAIKEYLPRDTAVREAGATVRPKSAAVQEDFTWGMDRFLAEAQTLAQFQHPNLVGVVRYFKANGTAYIVMDYVEGEVLASYIAREAPLSEAVLRGILEPVMDGLIQVHGSGYLHRDIKPDNIVLRADGSPVLLGFVRLYCKKFNFAVGGAVEQAGGEKGWRGQVAAGAPGGVGSWQPGSGGGF